MSDLPEGVRPGRRVAAGRWEPHRTLDEINAARAPGAAERWEAVLDAVYAVRDADGDDEAAQVLGAAFDLVGVDMGRWFTDSFISTNGTHVEFADGSEWEAPRVRP